MRITADIFDEESHVCDKVFTPDLNQLVQSDPKSPDFNWFFNKFPCQKASVKEGNPEPIFKAQNVNLQFQKIHEIIQKFKNLQLSDMSSPLKKDNLTDLEIASTSKPMEKANGDSTDAVINSVVPPTWLQQYLQKMKHEIKKEILDELLHAQGEVLCFKTGATNKTEENQFDFHGEVIHSGIFCDNCDQQIHGIRYKCGNCSDFDLCQECESLPNIHNKNHIFLKIRNPVTLKFYEKQKMLELLSSPSSSKIYMSSRNRQTKKLYAAKFVCDETIPDTTVLPPSTKFVKSWRVVNSGTRIWTHATKLHLIQGSADLVPNNEHVDVPHLKPGEEGIVSVIFTSPATPGLYRSHWSFCHKSRPFGDFVWCHIIVKHLTADGEKKVENVVAENTCAPNINISADSIAENKQNEASCIAQVLTAVKKEHERGNLVPRKLVVTSHTATPNNTPFDLTPPKSPDHHETSIKEVHELTSNSQARESDNEDDECSILSFGSSDSDTEFVVIPMPKCFDLTESFSQHMSQLVDQYQHKSDDVQKIVNMIQSGKQPSTVKISENVSLPNSAKKFTTTAETVSQETGVPELSENPCDQTVIEVVENQKDVQTNYVSVVTDGSSSEISIIESEDNSPVIENAAQTIGSINISLSSGGISNMQDIDKFEVHVLNSVPVKEETVQVDQTKTEEHTEDIPCNSATFPKFPVEGITSIYDPTPASNEERTVQVLPEGLVTGALSAAASFYNTARAVISTIQQPPTGENSLSQELNRNPLTGQLNPMDQLVEMGFCNRQQNEELLKKHNGDVPLVVAELVSLNDNDWYASRHIPSPPPNFD